MITAINLHWKRSDNTRKIIESLKRCPLVKEIIVWNNNKDVVYKPKSWEKVINTSEDFGLDTRFVAALLAKNDTILTIDDDNLVPEHTIKQLYENWKKEPEILHSLDGRKPTEKNEYADDVMLGHKLNMVEAPICLTRCTMYSKEYAALYVQSISKIRKNLEHTIIGNGEDIVLSYVVRNAAKGKLHKIYRLPRQELPSPHSIHRVPGHKEFRTLIMRKCQDCFELN
jgi:hypothetical protein